MNRNTVLRAVGYGLGGVFACASIVANARYSSGQGAELIDRALYVVSSVGSDGLKIVLPLFGVMLWRGHRGMAFGAFIFWIVCAFWSGFSALGWASTSTGVVVSEKDNAQALYDRAVKRVSDAEAAVKRVGAHRPLDVVVELMNAAQGAVPAVRWRLSKECTDVTTDASREACAEYQALKIEEATAREGERLASELHDARARLDETAMPVGSADPQAETLQKVLGFIGIDVTRKTARTLLNVGVVLLIDVAASTMFTLTFVATGGSDDGAKGGATRRGGEKSLRDEELTPDNSASQKITVTRQRIPRAGEAVGVVSLWAAARLSAVPGASVTCGDTFKDFEAWAEANGQPRIDPVKFGVAAAAIVSGLGGEKVKRRDARYFDGIAIIEGTVQ